MHIQAQDNSILTALDKIEVSIDSDGNVIYAHSIQKGQTVYSLARAFGTTSYEVLKLNNIPKDQPIALNQIIQIPIAQNRIFKGVKVSRAEQSGFLPIYYIVKPKDNLFRISKIYFYQEISSLMERNGKSDQMLSPGEPLIVGWLMRGVSASNHSLPQQKTQADVSAATQTEDEALNTNPELVVETISDQTETIPADMTSSSTLSSDRPEVENLETQIPVHIRQTRGIAIWDKKSSNMGSMYVMHHTAKINSEIEIYNPTIRRTIKAKVVGRIPSGTYPGDVALIITPRVAHELGALDSRLMVEMKFAE